MELTHSYCAVCSDDIHSQLQRIDYVSTLFDFCINPSYEDSVKAVYYEGFMQKMLCIIPFHE